LLAAYYARATHPFDEVWLLPAFRHPFGKSLIDFDHRVRMCEAMCRDASGWLKVCDAEREVSGLGWTVEVLKHLSQKNPAARFTVIVGSDILADLVRWKDVDELRSLAQVLVIHRAGHPSPSAVGPALAQVSSSEVRQKLERGELVEPWVPRAVLEYARRHHLYGL
jgi:nicotinate-nucleotide adenylyltransferase